jgi:hypothetical protein
MGIGDTPQQAKMQGVYHLALLATFVKEYIDAYGFLWSRL